MSRVARRATVGGMNVLLLSDTHLREGESDRLIDRLRRPPRDG